LLFIINKRILFAKKKKEKKNLKRKKLISK